MPKLRLGIDVGGTFTDVVAIDAATRSVVASIKVPTTHDAPEGVAAGIVRGIEELFARNALDPASVAFIAHSTTQATNALLEGDVARVAVVGLLERFGALAKAQMRFPPFDLAPGARFQPAFVFGRSVGEACAAVDALNGAVDAIAVSSPFGVDFPDDESRIVDRARTRDLAATAGHEVSSMYGLRARTRTAALNAAILPKMVRTARMTDEAVRRATISTPLMVMRSDGGVMDVREIERRPILTMLSGPAAGVAGALLHENVTDGIFVEVGGTSADCSAIRSGMPQMRPARIGGHRTMLRTIDVRTVGIGGGSMVRVDGRAIVDAGPRSAHIAGLGYAAFTDAEALRGAKLVRIQPAPHDPADYAVLACADGRSVALTTTCAANLLGLIPAGAFANGNRDAVEAAFEIFASSMGSDPQTLAHEILERASQKVLQTVERLVADYELDRQTLTIVGGGGGAGALVPYVSQRSGFEFRLAKNAEVISPIGVALALVREVVERIVVDPRPEDILRIRREAEDAVIASGAAADRVEVSVEIDRQRNLVRAVASGASELAESAAHGRDVTPEEQRAIAARLLRTQADRVERVEATPMLTIYSSETGVRVLDDRGVSRLSLRRANVLHTTASAAAQALPAAIEEATSFGDVGRALPELYVLHGGRIADFSGLASADQAVALAREELAELPPDGAVAVLTAPRPA